MEKVQKLQKAKLYLDMLAASMDPLTQEFIDDEILQRKEIKNLLTYVSGVIEELIWNNGDVVNVSKPMDFQASKLDKFVITLSDEPIQLTTLLARINKQVDARIMRRLGPSRIAEWLVDNGYLIREKVPVVRQISQLFTTESSEDFGIVIGEKTNVKTGEIKSRILLTRKAQEYIVDNLESILGEEGDENNSDVPEGTKPSMNGQPWTRREDEQLLEEYKERRLSISEIAQLHRRDDSGVYTRLKRLGAIVD